MNSAFTPPGYCSCNVCSDKQFHYLVKTVDMQQVKSGDKVKVHYHGKLRSGETFDSSQGREPLEFTVGSGQVIKGFDQGVMGMQVGDKRTVEIPVQDAYGTKQDEMIIEFPRNQFPPDMKPEAGMQLMMNNGSGQSFPVTVTEVKEESVILDANHPLAGQDLIFDIELVEIVPTSKIIMP
jgi:FKBP-type peptidyl-prolyl cis-trans isomerase 2